MRKRGRIGRERGGGGVHGEKRHREGGDFGEVVYSAFIFNALLTKTVFGLTCYKCQNLGVSSSSLLSSSFNGKTNPSCKSLSGYVSSTTCPSGFKCGYIGGEVTVKVNYIFSK